MKSFPVEFSFYDSADPNDRIPQEASIALREICLKMLREIRSDPDVALSGIFNSAVMTDIEHLTARLRSVAAELTLRRARLIEGDPPAVTPDGVKWLDDNDGAAP